MRTARTNRFTSALLCGSALAILLVQAQSGWAQNYAHLIVNQVVAESVPSNATPQPGESIRVAINVDTRAIESFDNRLAAYQATLTWDPAVLQYQSFTKAAPPWDNPNVNSANAASGTVVWNDFLAGGADPARINLINFDFLVVGNAGQGTTLQLAFGELITALTRDLRGMLLINNGTVQVRSPNQAPVLQPIADLKMSAGTSQTVPLSASDPDGDPITLGEINLPAFAQLTDNGDGTGTLLFKPAFTDVGVYANLMVTATDNGTPALADTVSFTLVVTPAENPPKLDPIPDQVMDENTVLEVAIRATDADGDDIVLEVNNLPAFAKFTDNNNGTGNIRFAPGFEHAGIYENIEVVATDDGVPPLSDRVTFKLTVNNVNRPPKLTPLAFDSLTISEGALVEFNLTATDPDGDALAYSSLRLPAFGTLTDNGDGTGIIRFAPGFEDAGIYENIEVMVTDAGVPPLSDRVTFKLTINNVNRPPKLTPFAFDTLTISEGALVEFNLTATDPDGDALAYSSLRLPAFGTLTDNGDGTAKLSLAPGSQDAGKYPDMTIVVTDNGVPSLADSDAFDLTVTDAIKPLVCEVHFIAPAEGSTICDDSVVVVVRTSISGGITPYREIIREVNGVAVVDSIAKVALQPGSNTLVALCKVTDADGNTAEASDMVTVVASFFHGRVSITAPLDSTFTSATAVTVTAKVVRTGGVVPVDSICTINGDTVVVRGGLFNGEVNLAPGYNALIATCTYIDGAGCAASFSDTVVIFSDPTPPLCTMNFDNLPLITGEAVDEESGIAKMEVVAIDNRTVTFAPFRVGDPRVTFTSDKLDLSRFSNLVIKVTNRAGGETICDPVYVHLDVAQAKQNFHFDILSTDRYLFVHNHGLRLIRILINEHPLLLVASESGGSEPAGTYFIPFEGARTIDVSRFLVAGDNKVELNGDGAAGTSADLLFSDIRINGNTTGVREGNHAGTALPREFALAQNHPNPFNPETEIEFDVPASVNAVVTLRVYNMQGQLVRTLVQQQLPPGRHTVRWDGRDAHGRPVASGIYFYQLLSGQFAAVKRMALTK